jgi:hypothetical protein
MTNDSTGHNAVIRAAIVASLLMVVFGLTYRVLAARLLIPASNTPLDPNVLEVFPMQIADWTGHDTPLEEAVLREIGAEASINRLYRRGAGSESVSLFIAASGIAVGTLVGHAPEICNVWSGYTLIYDHPAQLPLGNQMNLSCKVLQFSRKGLLETEKRTVLYYYVADGQCYGDRSSLRSRVRHGSSMVRCVAQVQIVASTVSLEDDSTMGLVSGFAVDSASFIVRLFEEITRDSHAAPSPNTQGKENRQ